MIPDYDKPFRILIESWFKSCQDLEIPWLHAFFRISSFPQEKLANPCRILVGFVKDLARKHQRFSLGLPFLNSSNSNIINDDEQIKEKEEIWTVIPNWLGGGGQKLVANMSTFIDILYKKVFSSLWNQIFLKLNEIFNRCFILDSNQDLWLMDVLLQMGTDFRSISGRKRKTEVA